MKYTELIYLIEDAEQGSDLQTIESGKDARVELDNINKQLAALREAGDKMAALLGEDITDDQLTEALEAWEAANK